MYKVHKHYELGINSINGNSLKPNKEYSFLPLSRSNEIKRLKEVLLEENSVKLSLALISILDTLISWRTHEYILRKSNTNLYLHKDLEGFESACEILLKEVNSE